MSDLSPRPPVLAPAAPPAEGIAISARDLSKKYRIEKVGKKPPHSSLLRPFARLLGRGGRQVPFVKEFWALDGVTFDIARGERVAVIGRNGAGKTTLLKVLSRIVTPTRGEARIRGRLTSLLEVGTGFNNALTGRENVFVNASMYGLGKRETEERLEQIIEFSGIDPRFIDMRVKHYSSGMRVRLAFSIAAHLDPDILLLDEVLAVGDMAFQQKCFERVEGMLRQKRTVLFVSHDMSSVIRFTTRAIWLDQGRVVMDGSAKDVVVAYSEEIRKAVLPRLWTREIAGAPGAKATPEAGGDPAARDPARGAATPGATALPEDGPHLAAGEVLKEPPWAEMVSIGLIDKNRQELKAPTVDQKIGIEFVYDVLRSGKVILPGVNFYNDSDIMIFTAVYTDPEYMQKPKEKGRYLSILWVPPHLLNLGRVHVRAHLTTPVSGKLERHVVIPNALSFEVFEAPFGIPSARGTYREVKGVVRPLLSWETRGIE